MNESKLVLILLIFDLCIFGQCISNILLLLTMLFVFLFPFRCGIIKTIQRALLLISYQIRLNNYANQNFSL